MKRTITLFVGLAILLIPSLACSLFTPPVQTTNSSSVAETPLINPTQNSASTIEESTQSFQSIELVGQPSFIQYDTVVEYTFMVENPNQSVALLYTQYSTSVSDISGKVLASTPGSQIFTLLPGEKTAILSYINVNEGETASKVEVTINPNTGIKRNLVLTQPLFSTEQPRAIQYSGNPAADFTGILQSNLDQNMVDRINSEVRLTGLAFDEVGNFIGGGYTDLVYVPAKAKVPFEIPVNTLIGKPARIEYYPDLVDFDILQTKDAGENLISIVAQNVTVDPASSQFSGSFTIENKDPQRIIENWVYQITAYDSDGVLSTYSQPVECLLYPGEKTGIVVNASGTPAGKKFDRVEVQVGSGEIYTGTFNGNPIQKCPLP